MKSGIFLLGLLMAVQSDAQSSDSCFVFNLKTIGVFVCLKGYTYNDTIYLKSNSFQNGLELVSPNSSKILSFKVLLNRAGADLIEINTCGNAIPVKYLTILNTFFNSKTGWLVINNINIEINGRRY